jgi:hypothetical protein
MTPGPGQARATTYQGTLDEWRDEARAMADQARSHHRLGAILAAVAAVMPSPLQTGFFKVPAAAPVGRPSSRRNRP